MSGSDRHHGGDAVRVRDLPTRVFHWTLAALVVGSVSSAWIGGHAMAWHLGSGYAVFTLLAFRILCGLAGGRWSRFASFVYTPATPLRCLRGESRADEHHDVGHNPLGAFSVFGLLAILAAQVATGVFADDEMATTAPLTKFVSDATISMASRWHRNVGQWLIVALVVPHIAAILFYLSKKQRNLLRPMLTGDKWLPAHVPAAIDNPRSHLLALALALFAPCAAGVTWVVGLGD